MSPEVRWMKTRRKRGKNCPSQESDRYKNLEAGKGLGRTKN